MATRIHSAAQRLPRPFAVSGWGGGRLRTWVSSAAATGSSHGERPDRRRCTRHEARSRSSADSAPPLGRASGACQALSKLQIGEIPGATEPRGASSAAMPTQGPAGPSDPSRVGSARQVLGAESGETCRIHWKPEVPIGKGTAKQVVPSGEFFLGRQTGLAKPNVGSRVAMASVAVPTQCHSGLGQPGCCRLRWRPGVTLTTLHRPHRVPLRLCGFVLPLGLAPQLLLSPH
ncbi:hypothetical protein TREES_T100014818 [Tupaia chinensis]|uniref:Uncharacterized protein n=1 Tax=Tupaia chinensis TaxID=246437 RepID=L9KTG6_TUPCH|nr:hypothetical protein TREES_T100014818 [Tupaia chinensis]